MHNHTVGMYDKLLKVKLAEPSNISPGDTIIVHRPACEGGSGPDCPCVPNLVRWTELGPDRRKRVLK